MRQLRTTASVLAAGNTKATIEWALKTGRWTNMVHGVLGRGPEPPSDLDVARATAFITNGVAEDSFAGVLHNSDGVELGTPGILVPRNTSARRPGVIRTARMPDRTVVRDQVKCTCADDTLLRLASSLDDLVWEQAAEHGLFKKYVTSEQVAGWSNARAGSARRVQRFIVARGGLEVRPTESLLETLAVQLIRRDPYIPTPTRQFRVFDPTTDRLEARVDLCWPELGLFLELDGQQHKNQPVYDAARQNKVTAILGWRCARLTWDQVHQWPTSTLRELRELCLGSCSLT